MFEYDELRLYRGKPIYINRNFCIVIPTLNQIEEFGEKRYFGAIHNFTAVGADLKWQLWDVGIDYTQIDDYDLFVKLISQVLSSKKNLYYTIMTDSESTDKTYTKEELREMLINPLQLILKETISNEKLFMEITNNFEKSGIFQDNYGNEYSDDFVNSLMDNPYDICYRDFDFCNYSACIKNENNQIILHNPITDITFDRMAYNISVDIIRKIHGLKRNSQIPANERTKLDLIDDARDEYMVMVNKPYKSVLQPLISTLQVYTCQCGDNNVWNIPISAFFDNIKRIGKVQDS